MNVAVTGGLGFIGERLVAGLAKEGHMVRIIDIRDPPEFGSGSNVELTTADVTDIQQITRASKGAQLVYHLAGTVLDEARKNTNKAAKLEVLGTANVLEACRINNVEKIIHASSFYVYDGLDPCTVVDESHFGKDLFKMETFGAVKLMAEKLVREYNKKYGLKYVILRFGPAYGPKNRCTSVVSTFVKAGLEGKPIVIWGEGTRKNQYTYLDDIGQGSILALKETNDTFNLISPEQTEIRKLASILQERYGFKVEYDKSRREGASMPYMSSRKANEKLGWKTTPLYRGIEKTVEEFKNLASHV